MSDNITNKGKEYQIEAKKTKIIFIGQKAIVLILLILKVVKKFMKMSINQKLFIKKYEKKIYYL